MRGVPNVGTVGRRGKLDPNDRTEASCVSQPQRDNLLIVHWHDLGRCLGAYGYPGVSSPRLDQGWTRSEVRSA